MLKNESRREEKFVSFAKYSENDSEELIMSLLKNMTLLSFVW